MSYSHKVTQHSCMVTLSLAAAYIPELIRRVFSLHSDDFLWQINMCSHEVADVSI